MPKAMHSKALGFLLAATSQFALAQDMPGAALMRSSFFGSGAYAPPVRSSREVRLALDSAGNRYILWAKFDILSMVPHQGSTYGYRSFVVKAAPDSSTVWEYAVTNERFTSLTVDPAGNLTVAGERFSGSLAEGFVRRIDTAGSGGVTTELWTVPVNGSPTAIASDAVGNLYVTGTPDSSFQATPGAAKPGAGEAKCSDKYGTTYFPCADAFVLKLSADGQRTIYATWLGGTGGETASDIAVGLDGSAYVVGETTSPDFPTTPGAAQRTYGGTINLGPLSYGDGFVVRIDPAGRSFLYSTYLGTAGADALLTIALDRTTGNALVGGSTEDRDVLPGSRPDALIALLGPAGGLIRNTRLNTPDISDRALSTSVSPEGRMFVGINDSIVELSPATLNPVRRTRLRTYATPDVIAQSNGVLYVASAAGTWITDVFAVPPGQYAYGSVYSAQYDFNSSARPSLMAIVNAASYHQGRQFGGATISVAPNELVTIFGEAMLAPVRVTVGGRSLPILYSSEMQINTLIPGDMPVGNNAEITVEAGGRVIGPYSIEVTTVVPALFTQPGTPNSTVSAAAINQDGTINSREHPAPPGSVIALFGTGLGRLTPERLLVEHVEAYGPGGPGGGMEVLYAGEAPGLAGVQQVNVRIHSDTPAGASPYTSFILVAFGAERTQYPVVVWIGIP